MCLAACETICLHSQCCLSYKWALSIWVDGHLGHEPWFGDGVQLTITNDWEAWGRHQVSVHLLMVPSRLTSEAGGSPNRKSFSAYVRNGSEWIRREASESEPLQWNTNDLEWNQMDMDDAKIDERNWKQLGSSDAESIQGISNRDGVGVSPILLWLVLQISDVISNDCNDRSRAN